MATSMGVFSAVMYRQHLHDSIVARAKSEHPDMGEDELLAVPVALQKPVSFTLKKFLCEPLKVKVTAMVAGSDGVPRMVCEYNGKESRIDFGEMPNHTLHRVLELLKAPTADMDELVLKELSK
jgi:hypothetical protein